MKNQNKERNLLWFSSLCVSPLLPGALSHCVSHAPLPVTGTQAELADGGLTSKTSRRVHSLHIHGH